jgi:hypothetical protein
MMEIQLDPIKWERFETWRLKQVIPDPPDFLRDVYEKRVLMELTGIRAEKYDSPEHREELLKLQEKNKTKEVPRNNQNHNFEILMEMHTKLFKTTGIEDSIPILMEIKAFVEHLGLIQPFYYVVNTYDKLFDVRCCEDLTMYFNYILTYRSHKISTK